MSFPKIIHQTWRTQDLPPFIARCTASVRKRNSEWDYLFYTDRDLEKVLARQDLFSSSLFHRLPSGIQKADVFRCLALYSEGGAYVDVDILALRSFDSLIDACQEWGLVSRDTEVILTTDHPVHCRNYGGQEVVMNHFMIARPRSEFLRQFIGTLARNAAGLSADDTNPLETTGPLALTDFIEANGGPESLGVALVPYFWINPLPDMSLEFMEHAGFDEMIRDESWVARFCPFLAHFWWHSNWPRENMMDYYGETLLAPASKLPRAGDPPDRI